MKSSLSTFDESLLLIKWIAPTSEDRHRRRRGELIRNSALLSLSVDKVRLNLHSE